MARIAILGASGVYGRHLAPGLVAAGHEVRALVRRPEAAGIARGCGADVRLADIFDESSMVAAMEGCDVSINLATSLPGPSGRGDYAVNDRVRREGAPVWLKACERAGVKRANEPKPATAGNDTADSPSGFQSPIRKRFYGFGG